MVEFRILRGGRTAKRRTTALDFRRADFSFYRGFFQACKNPMGCGSGEKRGAGELVYNRGSPPARSRNIHHNK